MVDVDTVPIRPCLEKGDLVIWDNRGLFHVAGAWDKVKHRRHIWRCSIGAV